MENNTYCAKLFLVAGVNPSGDLEKELKTDNQTNKQKFKKRTIKHESAWSSRQKYYLTLKSN